MPVTPDQYRRREEIMAGATEKEKPLLRTAFMQYEQEQSAKPARGLEAIQPDAQQGAGANVLESEGHTPPAENLTSGISEDWTSLLPPDDTADLPPAARPPGTSPQMGTALQMANHPGHLIDQTLPNASKLKKFQEPPEYNPQGASLPNFLGGDVVQLYEPSHEQFEADMGPILAVRGIQSDKDPRYQNLYAEYSDRMYANAYHDAVANNRPIVRVDYALKNDKSLGALANYLAAKGAGATFAFTEGALNNIVPGGTEATLRALQPLTDEPLVDQFHEGQAANPFAAGAGAFVGASSPASLPGEVGGLVSKGLNFGVKSRILGGALGGAAGAGVASILGNEAAGVPTQDTLHELGTTSLPIGGLLGAGGQALAEGATGYRKWLRGSRIGHELGNFEEAGGATKLLGGLEAPPEIENAVEATRKAFPGESKSTFAGSPVEFRANLLKEPLSQANAEALSTTREAQQRESADFASRYLAGRKVPLRTTLIEAVKELRARSRSNAPAIPGTEQALPGAENGKLADFIRRSMKPEVVPTTQVQSAMASRGGVAALPLDEAQAMGFDVNRELNNLPPDDPRRLLLQQLPSNGGPSHSDAFRVVLVPHDFDAQEMDGMISMLDHRAGEVNPDPMWDMLRAVARKDREQFGPAWNELKSRQADRLGELEHRSERAGLPTGNPRPYNRLGTNEQVRFDSTLEGAGSTQQKEPSLAALRSLADEAGGQNPKNLRLLVGQRSYDALRNSGETPGIKPVVTSGGSYARLGGLGPAIELRLDALARILSRNPQGLSSVTYAELGPELQSMLRKGKALPPSAIEHQRPGALTNMFGLGGGGLGIRAAQAYSATGKELLSDDDIATLLAMIRGRQSGQQVAEATQ